MSNLDSMNSGAEHTEENAWQEIARKQKTAGMGCLDYLVYSSERLACTGQEKDICLETVRKLVRLCYEIRRNGILVAGILAEKEEDPFFRACLLELECDEGYIETEDMPVRLERVLAAYLAAGDYRGGAFLSTVVAAKGIILLCRHLDAHPTVFGALLSVEIRGFFGVEYRECVIAAIKREIRAHAPSRETSLVPAFDELTRLSVDQRRRLLQNVELYTLEMALRGAGAAVEDALLEALEEEKREHLEREWDYNPNAIGLFAKDIERAQSEILALMES